MSNGIAYYDLSVSPPTYDFISFLLGAELWRLRMNLTALDIRILAGPEQGFRRDNLPPFTAAERRAMLDNIVLPAAWLLPSVASIAECEDVAPAQPSIGWRDPRYGLHVMVAAAAKNCYPLAPPLSERVRHKAPYATITLREASYWPERNSTIGEWLKVAAALERRKLQPIFVRDTARAGDQVATFATDVRASRDVSWRAALYAGAALNLFVGNGPAWVSWFMGAPTLICKLVSRESPSQSASTFVGAGLKPGTQPANARAWQALLWEDDRADKIVPAVDQLLGLVHGE